MRLTDRLRNIFDDLVGTALTTNNVDGVGFQMADYMLDMDPLAQTVDGYSGSDSMMSMLDMPAREAEGLMTDGMNMSRRQRYLSYDSLEELVPEVDATLNLYADEATSYDSEYHTISIRCSNQGVREELEFLFFKLIQIDDKAYAMTRSLAKYGDYFGELVVDPNNPQLGVMKLNDLDPYTMWRIQTRRGKLLEFQQTRMSPDYDIVTADLQAKWAKDNAEETELAIQWAARGRYDKQERPGLIRFAPGQIIHMALGGEKRGHAPYGTSILVSARKAAYNLRLLEDSMLLYRLVRAPERRVYYIDLGQLPPNRVESFVQEFRNKVKRKKIYNEKTGQIDERYNPWPVRRTTPIPLLDGRTITIEEIAREYEQGKTNWVYSILDGPDGRVVPGKIVWCGKNYHCTNLVRVWMDDCGYVDVAPEHPFVLRDGSSKRADELQHGDSIMPLYRKISSEQDHKRVVGYPMIRDNADGQWKFVHKVVAEHVLEQEKVEVSSRTDWNTNSHMTVHHKNFNRHDATPDNLQWIGDNDHRLLHLDLVNARWNGENAEEARSAERQRMNDRWSGPEAEALRAKVRASITAYNTTETKRRKTSEDNKKYGKGKKLAAGYNGTALHQSHNAIRRTAVRKHWQDAAQRAVHCEAMRWIIPNEIVEFVFDVIQKNSHVTRTELTNLIRSNVDLMQTLQAMNPDGRNIEKFHVTSVVDKLFRAGMIEKPQYRLFRNYALQHAAPLNHQVTKIEHLKDESDDVYCMTIVGPNGEHDRHNFAVQESGIADESYVFVKNSVDDDLFLPVRANSNTRVDTLPGAQNLGEIDDAMYFRRKFYLSVGIPPGYLEQTIEAQTNRLTLSSQAMVFAKKVYRIQRVLAKALMEIATRHLILQGVPETLYEDLSITVTPPSEWRELAQAEVLNSRATLASQYSSLNVVSGDYVRMEIMHLSEDENEEEKRRMFQQKIEEAEIAAQASLIAARANAEIERGNQINQAKMQAELAAATGSVGGEPPPPEGPGGGGLEPNSLAGAESPTVDQLAAAAPEPSADIFQTEPTAYPASTRPRRTKLDPADAEAEREGA